MVCSLFASDSWRFPVLTRRGWRVPLSLRYPLVAKTFRFARISAIRSLAGPRLMDPNLHALIERACRGIEVARHRAHRTAADRVRILDSRCHQAVPDRARSLPRQFPIVSIVAAGTA